MGRQIKVLLSVCSFLWLNVTHEKREKSKEKKTQQPKTNFQRYNLKQEKHLSNDHFSTLRRKNEHFSQEDLISSHFI